MPTVLGFLISIFIVGIVFACVFMVVDSDTYKGDYHKNLHAFCWFTILVLVLCIVFFGVWCGAYT